LIGYRSRIADIFVRVVIARAAERDLFSIQRRIAADSPVRATSFVSDLAVMAWLVPAIHVVKRK